MPGYYNQNYYSSNYRRNFNKRFNRNRKYIKKSRGGRTKQLVDGNRHPWIRAGMNAMPYVIKSIGLLKSLINTEPKFVDTPNSVMVSSTVQYARLTGMAQGTTDQTRIGNKILLKDVLLRFNTVLNPSGATNTIRLILFVDKESDAVLPVSPQPLQVSTPTSPINMDSSKRYVIIKDWLLSLSQGGLREFSTKFYNELNIHCEYDGATGAITDMRENQLFFAWVGIDNVNQSSLTYYSRVKFYDS